MELSDYQTRSRVTAVYPGAGENLIYPTLGLAGEAGEVAEKVKKLIRDDAGVLTDERRAAIAKELGFRQPDGLLVSALSGEGLEQLQAAIAAEFDKQLADVELLLPYAEGARLAELHELAGEDLARDDRADGVLVRARLPREIAERYSRFALNGSA